MQSSSRKNATRGTFSCCWSIVMLCCCCCVFIFLGYTDVSVSLHPHINSNFTLSPVTSQSATLPPRTLTNTTTPSPPRTLTNTATSSPPRTLTNTTASSPPLTSQSTTSNSQTTIQTNSSASYESSPTPTSTPFNQTLLPVIPSNTTVTSASTALQPTSAPPCSYDVKNIKFGFSITMTILNNDNYTINVKEREQTNSGKTSPMFSNGSTHDIKHLKPCTDYELAFINSVGQEIVCTGNRTTFTTDQIQEGDIQNVSYINGYVCYHSDWNTNSTNSLLHDATAKSKDQGEGLCVKYDTEDICSDFTFFSSKKCMNSSFHLNKSIPLDSHDINQTLGYDRLPTQINATFPPKCKHHTAENYTCSEIGKGNVSRLSILELKPFTNYSCTGLIKENNVSTNQTTPAIQVMIDCKFNITNIKNTATNTSISLEWETISEKCRDVLAKLDELSYKCNCTDDKHNLKPETLPVTKLSQPTGGKCDITGLKPFTNYSCKINPTYKNENVKYTNNITTKTDVGTLTGSPAVTVIVAQNNVIMVKCTSPFDELYGPTLQYTARLNSEKECTKAKCNFEFKDLSYLTTYTVEVAAFNGKFLSQTTTQKVSTLYNDKAVVGFLVFLIILTSVALLWVGYKIYILKRRNSHDLSENIMLISNANDEENLMPVEPIAADALLESYKRKLADEARLFLAEFQSIPRIFSRYSVKEAKKSCNVPKNRYVDILPYDYNRVQLTTGNGEAGCDYINASFIDGFKESKKYIAAQGPKDETVSDFWRMVWEQQSSIIVMVTRCEEGNRVKCAQYWPSLDRETEIFEEFIVKLNSEEDCPDYTIRRLSLTNKREKNSEREVTHIQFMSWPDHGVPGDPNLLLKLRQRVNSFKNLFSGPIIVHCSAGVGRTGTYIGIDAMMEGLEAEGRMDIYGYVVKLRRQRCLMVQVEAQYILIHQALLEHNQFGETETTLSELHSTLNALKQRSSSNEPTLMEDEFERLPTFKNWRTFNTGITEENKKKNRSSSVIPYDYNRVLLKMDEGRSQDSDNNEDDEEESSDEEDEDSTKYINASHIDGYWGPRAFIAAQTPLPDTVADFWLMVYQKKASAIVMLSDCSEGDKEPDSVYWGKDKKTFGDIEVEVASTDTSPTSISRNMLIRHVKRKESRPVKHFQFLKWESGELPENSQDLTDTIKDIKHRCTSNKSQKGIPVVVHCNNGSSRSGIFCALWKLLDSAQTEKLLDVFQVVKTLRKERQGMVSSLEHYQFLYNALEGVFPAQNGEVKPVEASAADSVQIVNETKAAEQPAEKAEQPASTTSNDQQGAADSAPLVADGGKEDKVEEPVKGPGVPPETTPLEDTTVTVEV
ncbi:receptor-type tyrosine-protein phosphatase C isoform X1 [Embiotoca jacksoni]|uniref:receptor-type tyrosine-protein phosphatase C isoform X1 n=1 Tax=Embiotoca jacksoni TaxID=100190 RepID=UPI0037040EAA